MKLSNFVLCAVLSASPLLTSAASCDKYPQSKDGVKWQTAMAPTPSSDENRGWSSIPGSDEVCGSKLEDLSVGTKGATVPIYVSDDVDDSKVSRVVITIPGKLRDSWTYFTLTRNARNHAVAKDSSISQDEVAVIVPMFFNRFDVAAGAVGDNTYSWNGNSWSRGGHAALPEDASPIHTSGFEVFDDMVKFARKRYPNVSKIVLAGHSMGAQATNRYAMFGGANGVEYFTANPGSWLWLSKDRHNSPDNCPTYNDYKYGLDGFLSMYLQDQKDSQGGNDGLLKRLFNRKVHIVMGAADFGPGDTSCMAKTQGSTHLARGHNYKDNVEAVHGSYPSSWTYDEAPGCTHNATCIWNSDAGLDKLFIEN